MGVFQRIVTVTGPALPPVTVEEARVQCSLLSDSTHDEWLLRLIKAATLQAETYCGMRILQQTVRIELDAFPDGMGVLELATHPIQSITSVKYDDTSNVERTLTGSGTDYWADLAGVYPRLCPVDGWPDTYPDKPAVVRIVAVVGYSNPGAVPQDIKDAILVRVAERFRNPEELVAGANTAVSVVAPFEALLHPYRRLTL